MSIRPLSMPRGILFDFGDTVIRTVSSDPMAGNARILELAENQNGLTAEQLQQCADEIEADVARKTTWSRNGQVITASNLTKVKRAKP